MKLTATTVKSNYVFSETSSNLSDSDNVVSEIDNAGNIKHYETATANEKVGDQAGAGLYTWAQCTQRHYCILYNGSTSI